MTALGVTDIGTGPNLLFLHGIGSSRRSFDAQIDWFSPRYRCLAPDAPGYATSNDPPAPDGDPMDMFAAAYEHLIGDDPFVVVGVSFGGVVAIRMALRGRANIVGLVLADTSRGSGADPAKADAMRGRAAALAVAGASEFSRQRAPRLVHSDDPALVERVTDTMAQSIRLPGYGYAADAMAATDHTGRLAAIAVPTLVVVGEHDQICPPSEAATIAASVPGAELVTVAGAGHLANVEQPESFNRLIDPFIQRVYPHATTKETTHGTQP